jgi:hypothetical protein
MGRVHRPVGASERSGSLHRRMATPSPDYRLVDRLERSQPVHAGKKRRLHSSLRALGRDSSVSVLPLGQVASLGGSANLPDLRQSEPSFTVLARDPALANKTGHSWRTASASSQRPPRPPQSVRARADCTERRADALSR